MGARKSWDDLSPGYRDRLISEGITRESHAAGADLKGARGHRSTPEHPQEAKRNPQQYTEYRERQNAKYIQGITKDGVQLLKLSARDRNTVARHWNAVEQWMRGKGSDLDTFKNKTVHDEITKKNVQFETDPNAIWRLAHARQTDIPVYPELQ